MTAPATPPRRLDVLARDVETRSNFRWEPELTAAFGDVTGRREAHDQPTPRRSVKAVKHLLRLTSDHFTKADKLLRLPLCCRIKQGTLTRGSCISRSVMRACLEDSD